MVDPQGRLDPLLEVADGTLNEGFDRPERLDLNTADSRRRQLVDMSAATRAGKIVILKAWPRFSFLMPPGAVPDDYPQRVAQARADITFPLAAFLAAARRHAYFAYSWGYHDLGIDGLGAGAMLYADYPPGPVDPAWYPELLRPLGEPLDDPRLDGYVWARRFKHADVRLDIAARQASIRWCHDA
jgi:hypothetical protein